MIRISLLLLISGLSVNHATTYCYDSYECDRRALSDDNLYCNGFHSCELATITTSGLTYCGGYYGCASSYSINSYGSSVLCL